MRENALEFLSIFFWDTKVAEKKPKNVSSVFFPCPSLIPCKAYGTVVFRDICMLHMLHIGHGFQGKRGLRIQEDTSGDINIIGVSQRTVRSANEVCLFLVLSLNIFTVFLLFSCILQHR